MKITLPDEALNQIFGEARTHSAWLEKPVSYAGHVKSNFLWSANKRFPRAFMK